ncbi:MAG: ABC transporter ATP-binding protein, partial [Sphingomicrobium sp.]
MTSLLSAANIAIEGRLLPTNLEFAPGEMVALVGPNGGGKTSLLRSLAQVDDCEGVVIVSSEELGLASPGRRARLVGFLPASRELVWPLSVRDIITLGGAPDEAKIPQILELLELQPLADRRVDHLSTGERTRALIGRILAASPKVML